MAADQERAERIRSLKAERPDLTWRRIGDAVGVSERSAFEWGKKGGIDYDNAKRLAELFEVDVDYIWRGTGTTPDPFAGTTEERLANIEGMLEEILGALGLRQPDEDDAPARLVEIFRDAAARAGAVPEDASQATPRRRAGR